MNNLFNEKYYEDEDKNEESIEGFVYLKIEYIN